jgi:ABC-type glutathione transport system ATPase component
VVVAGPSGCGKTTLFNLLGALDGPDSGSALFGGSDLGRLTSTEKTLVLRRKAGFVFQSFNLVPALTAYENVECPLGIDGLGRAERQRRTHVGPAGTRRRGPAATLIIAVIVTARGMIECRRLARPGAALEGKARDLTSTSEG